MPTSTLEPETISSVFRYLVKRSGKSIAQIHEATKIPEMTLYSLFNRQQKKADLNMLRVLANYFDEALDVFCGLNTYRKPRKLTPEEELLVNKYETLSDEAKLQVIGFITRLTSNPENVVRLI